MPDTSKAYKPTGSPFYKSAGMSAVMRDEFKRIAEGFKIVEDANDDLKINKVDAESGTASDLILTGTPTAPTAGQDTNTNQIATTAFVMNQRAETAPLAAAVSGSVGVSSLYAREDHIHPESTNAREWATKMGGMVDDIDYSAKYYAGESAQSAVTAKDKADEAVLSAIEAEDWSIAAQSAYTNATSMLGINFGNFAVVNGDLIVTHISTSAPSLVDGDLILNYETV